LNGCSAIFACAAKYKNKVATADNNQQNNECQKRSEKEEYKQMPPKADWDKYVAPLEDEENKPEEKIVPLSEGDIQVLRTYVSLSVATGGDLFDTIGMGDERFTPGSQFI
jgi:hypothetical protein